MRKRERKIKERRGRREKERYTKEEGEKIGRGISKNERERGRIKREI